MIFTTIVSTLQEWIELLRNWSSSISLPHLPVLLVMMLILLTIFALTACGGDDDDDADQGGRRRRRNDNPGGWDQGYGGGGGYGPYGYGGYDPMGNPTLNFPAMSGLSPAPTLFKGASYNQQYGGQMAPVLAPTTTTAAAPAEESPGSGQTDQASAPDNAAQSKNTKKGKKGGGGGNLKGKSSNKLPRKSKTPKTKQPPSAQAFPPPAPVLATVAAAPVLDTGSIYNLNTRSANVSTLGGGGERIKSSGSAYYLQLMKQMKVQSVSQYVGVPKQ